MKQILKEYAAYHYWANKQITDAILKMDPSLWQKEVDSSFPSLHHTILHLWDAGSIWWQRLKLQEVVTPPSAHFSGTTLDLVNNMLHQDKLWLNWVEGATEAALEHVFSYRNSKKEEFKEPRYQMLLHLFNHGTYHRGQLVTMMRTLGVKQVPGTDFILWARKR